MTNAPSVEALGKLAEIRKRMARIAHAEPAAKTQAQIDRECLLAMVDQLTTALANTEAQMRELRERAERAETDREAFKQRMIERYDETQALKARVAELEKALEPFAKAAEHYDGYWDGHGITSHIDVGDLRRAAAERSKP